MQEWTNTYLFMDNANIKFSRNDVQTKNSTSITGNREWFCRVECASRVRQTFYITHTQSFCKILPVALILYSNRGAIFPVTKMSDVYKMVVRSIFLNLLHAYIVKCQGRECKWCHFCCWCNRSVRRRRRTSVLGKIPSLLKIKWPTADESPSAK